MKAAAAPSEFSIDDIFELVRPELADVELGLRDRVRSAVPVVEEINRYIHDSGGKRLRPTMSLLTSKMCGYSGPAVIHIGVILELIHVATLVHDDIIDNSRMRRGRPAVHSKWGNTTTVLMGDWLYMTCFYLALDLQEMRYLEILINITRKLVEGELMQLAHNGNIDITRDEQLAICMRKTAYLFAGCCKLSAIVAEKGPEAELNLWNFGQYLGMAFQLIDDLLDYTSTQAQMGKPNLKDLEEDKVTLPIIYLLQRAKPEDARFVREVVRNADYTNDNKRRIIELAKQYNTLSDVRKEATEYADKARKCLMTFPDNRYRQALLNLTQFVLDRKK
ncbi:MAG TPA: polyprenyl synthetase family protein [Acidobacteriota bacterium]|nr:polyprenyl synthetase family protein [Acidobacteriota bacterium]